MNQPSLDPFFGRRAVPVILQAETAECGHACVAMVAGYHGRHESLSSLRRRWSPSTRGVTLGHIIAMAKDLHLATRALRLELSDLRNLSLPAVIHMDMSHFVVLERVARDSILVVDPAVGRRRMPVREASRRFTGVALELRPAPDFARSRRSQPLRLSSFFQGVQGLWTALVKILVLSISMQIFLLVIPLFGQLVIDDIVLSGDRNLLAVLGVAFLLLVAIHACISAIRAWLVTTLGARLQFGWGARLFHRLIRLPLGWFERRHVGDIISRFQSIRAAENLVANSVVEAIVDGVMALATFVIMCVYSAQLAGFVVGALALYAFSRFALYGELRCASMESLALGAKADSLFLESVRAILPLKSYGREDVREVAWQNRRADAMNAEVRTRRIEVGHELLHTSIFGAEAIVVLWLGALAILAGKLSLGMLVAFISYKSQFTTRTAALIDKMLEFRLLELHLDRLADIALAETDHGTESGGASVRQVSGALELRGVSFRYADSEPYVVRDVNLKVEASECVAITGPSGHGKTTLLKLMMGLLDPVSGKVLVDGLDLRCGLLYGYRRQIASVMQDDTLLSGSLADNIAFFDPDADQERIEACARLAAIHDDIVQMPMGYLTAVGDMGSTLSGGQRQRVCLARALYVKPRILFLDEATSHLDPFTERRVHHSMRQLNMTRVIVAHRQETLAIADRIIQLPLSIAADGSHPRMAT